MTNVTVHEALKQAIEQLEVSWTICTDEDYMEGFRNAANLCKAALAELDKCEPELYMAKNLHNKSYATSHSEAEARLFLLQSGLKVDGIESEVISLCRCDTSPQPNELSVNGEWSKEVMEGWDLVRSLIADGDKSSYPRDWFESLAPEPQPRDWVDVDHDTGLRLHKKYGIEPNDSELNKFISEYVSTLKQLNTKG